MKDKIEKAYDTLIGYCKKRTWCEQGCRFYVKNVCVFQNELAPVDWDEARKGEPND